MARWAAGTPERLQKAALELFATRGFEQTTAAEIAEAVGLTERTFFRHFSEKREVLFHGQQALVEACRAGVAQAQPDASPMEVVAAALRAVGAFFTEERRPFSRARQAVIDQNPQLQERERHKLANLAAEIAAGLRDRGVGEVTAALAAECGMAVFAVAFGQWLRDDARSFAEITADVLAELHRLTAAPLPQG
ncbi:transcriptional regulator, TetR family [Pseudonocardia thermophila]|uniref:Transcriptional regulator, TetR family n=1 Tax=Pseudonocardia thermophila TaxID=1848 RepID=A0A1M6ZW22_PSETH|nr:TetR family transcriptional regulator [Pseudonocardia thermophila]SHL34672.1 transcriptional regulator, TetR family [Pseudonocardia thermophila]